LPARAEQKSRGEAEGFCDCETIFDDENCFQKRCFRYFESYFLFKILEGRKRSFSARSSVYENCCFHPRAEKEVFLP
jgi:hypothetical protein